MFPRLRRLRLRGLAARANAGRLSLRPNLPGSVPLLGQELLCGFISNEKKISNTMLYSGSIGSGVDEERS